MAEGHASQQLMEAFAAFTAVSERLQTEYSVLQGQLDRIQNELQAVLGAVPIAIWVLDEHGQARFTNRPKGMEGRFLDGPAPWEPNSPKGLRRFKEASGRESFFEQEHRPTEKGKVVTLRDVTESVLRAQQATREERLQAMGLMAAELAHEIRNPLGSLALFSGMLVQDLAGQPEQADLARRMQEGVQRLNTLVSNALTFSRDLTPHPARVELAGFWEEARKGCGAPAHIRWENRVPPQATWAADPDLLRQVAVNLLQNAARAMDEREAPLLTLDAAQEELEGQTLWHLVLEDNGRGIPQSDLSRVFDPFYSTFGGGTGLGLAVCHRIVMAHGGLLFLESKEDSGTSVHIRLPQGG
jgi:two-component system sensor histidine kinase FlrB